MNPAQIFANPSLMVLVCLIGGALREGVTRDLLVKLMVIGTFVPELGMAITGSMILEEAMGGDAPWHIDGDPADESGNPASGWVRQDGDGWVWRNVTKGMTMIIVFGGAPRLRAPRPRRWRRMARAFWRVVSALSQKLFFALDLAALENCALIVPGS
jgi:hypothetical protein